MDNNQKKELIKESISRLAAAQTAGHVDEMYDNMEEIIVAALPHVISASKVLMKNILQGSAVIALKHEEKLLTFADAALDLIEAIQPDVQEHIAKINGDMNAYVGGLDSDEKLKDVILKYGYTAQSFNEYIGGQDMTVVSFEEFKAKMKSSFN